MKTYTKIPLRNSSLILRPSKKGLLNWRARSKNSIRTMTKLRSVLLLNKRNNPYWNKSLAMLLAGTRPFCFMPPIFRPKLITWRPSLIGHPSRTPLKPLSNSKIHSFTAAGSLTSNSANIKNSQPRPGKPFFVSTSAHPKVNHISQRSWKTSRKPSASKNCISSSFKKKSSSKTSGTLSSKRTTCSKNEWETSKSKFSSTKKNFHKTSTTT